MALEWNVTRIKDYAVLWPDRVSIEGGREKREWNVVTEVLVWLSMFCGFNRITEQNAEEVYLRILMYEEVHGAMISNHKESEHQKVVNELRDSFACIEKPGDSNLAALNYALCAMREIERPQPIKRSDVFGHIGLTTNASVKTFNQFTKGMMENLREKCARVSKQEKANAPTA